MQHVGRARPPVVAGSMVTAVCCRGRGHGLAPCVLHSPSALGCGQAESCGSRLPVTRRVTEAQGDPGPWERRPPEDRCPLRTSSPLRTDAEPVELPDDTHHGRFPLGKALLAPTSTGQIWGSVRTSKISESLGLCLSPSFSFEPQREGGFSRDGGSRGTDSLMTN